MRDIAEMAPHVFLFCILRPYDDMNACEFINKLECSLLIDVLLKCVIHGVELNEIVSNKDSRSAFVPCVEFRARCTHLNQAA